MSNVDADPMLDEVLARPDEYQQVAAHVAQYIAEKLGLNVEDITLQDIVKIYQLGYLEGMHSTIEEPQDKNRNKEKK